MSNPLFEGDCLADRMDGWRQRRMGCVCECGCVDGMTAMQPAISTLLAPITIHPSQLQLPRHTQHPTQDTITFSRHTQTTMLELVRLVSVCRV